MWGTGGADLARGDDDSDLPVVKDVSLVREEGGVLWDSRAVTRAADFHVSDALLAQWNKEVTGYNEIVTRYVQEGAFARSCRL